MKVPTTVKKLSAVFLSVLLLLSLTACNASGYPENLSLDAPKEKTASVQNLSNLETTPVAVSPEPTVSTASSNTEQITLEQAKELVLQYLKAESGTFQEIDTDLEDGEYELEVTVDGNTYEFEINARTGEIKEFAREHSVSTPKEPETPAQNTPDSTRIGMDAAKKIVREHLADDNAVFVEAELDDGKYEFEVYSGNMEYDYEIHATSGKILKVERERRDHNDD